MARERTADECDIGNKSKGKRLLNRRSYLQMSAAAAATVAAGSSVTAAASSNKKEVNIVDAGADPNGSKPVTSLLKKVAGDNTRVVFPKGTYKINSTSFTNLNGFELVAPKGATLVPTSKGKTTMLFRLCKNLHFEGFTVDTSANNTAFAVGVQVVGGKSVIKDYYLKGRQDISQMSKGFWVKCEGKDTDLTFDNIYLGDGAENDGIGMYLFPSRYFSHKNRDGGSITLKDMHVEGWNHEGVYGSPHRGKLTVIGGLFKNNTIEQLRVGGGNHKQITHVKDVTIVVDNPPSYEGDGNPHGKGVRNYRGLWCEEGDGLVVENCDIHIGKVPLAGAHSSGALHIHKQFGRATVKDTRINVDMNNTPAIVAQTPQASFNGFTEPSMNHLPPKWTVNIDNVSITGSANGGAAILAENRKDVSLKNCCIQQTGTNRVGVQYKSAGGKVVDSTINTDGKAIVSAGSNVQTQNVSKDGTCKVPNLKPKSGPKISADGGSSTSGSSGNTSTQAGNATSKNSSTSSNNSTANAAKSSGNSSSKASKSSGSKTVSHSGGTSTVPPDGKLLEIIANDSGPLFSYSFTADGVQPATDRGHNSSEPKTTDHITKQNGKVTVNGKVGNGYGDAYWISGDVSSFEVKTASSNYTLKFDGSEMSVKDLTQGSSRSKNVISIQSHSKKVANYQLTVNGSLASSDANGGTFDTQDKISGRNAEGAVAGGTDSYAFSGSITDFTLSGPATVLLNGKKVDPATLGTNTHLPHVITIHGEGPNKKSNYKFTVSGEVARVAATTESEDTVRGKTAKGLVEGASDSYRFSGDLTSFNASGNATVNFNEA